MRDWVDDLFDKVESYDDAPRLREYCFNLWDDVDFLERFEAHDLWTRIECADLEGLQDILRELKDRLPSLSDKVRCGSASQREISEFINKRT